MKMRIPLVACLAALILSVSVWAAVTKIYPMSTPTTLAPTVNMYSDAGCTLLIPDGQPYDWGIPVSEGSSIMFYVKNIGTLDATGVQVEASSVECTVTLNQTAPFDLAIAEILGIQMTFTALGANPIHWTLQTDY